MHIRSFPRAIVLAALTALAAAQDPHVEVVNQCGSDIKYAMTMTGGAAGDSGTLASGNSKLFTMGTSYDIKMCLNCDPATSPASDANLLQFEYNLNATDVFYDWSLVDGANSDLVQFDRKIVPTNGTCTTFDCPPGNKDNQCQYTTPDNTGGTMGASCPINPGSGDNVQLMAIISK